MKKYVNRFLLIYLAGFAAGIFSANLLIRAEGFQTSLLPVYFAGVEQEMENAEEILFRLLQQRGTVFVFFSAVGFTAAAVPLVLGGILWYGFLGGNLISMFLLEYGLLGMLAGITCFLPQVLFYVPGWFLLFSSNVEMGQKAWKKEKKTGEDYRTYLFLLTVSAVLILLGIWTETYVNQNVLSFVSEHWL